MIRGISVLAGLVALAVVALGCSKKDSGEADPAGDPPSAEDKPPQPTEKAEPPPTPVAKAPAAVPASNMDGISGPVLVVDKPATASWDEGLTFDAMWNVDADTAIALRAQCDTDKERGSLYARHTMAGDAKPMHLADFPCSPATSGSTVTLAVHAAGFVVFQSSAGAHGQDPGDAVAVKLATEGKGKPVTVAERWSGSDLDDPPAWAK